MLTHDKNKSTYIPNLMRSFTEYFTQNIDIDEPIWTHIYEDAFGFGSMTTLVMPAYLRNETSGYKKLIAVAGIDIPI